MAHITLIRPPAVCSRSSFSLCIVPPLGPAYVAAALEHAGNQVAVIDALGEAVSSRYDAAHPSLVAYGLTIAEIVRRIPSDTQGIGVSVMFSQTWPHVEAIVQAIHAHFPAVPIFIGGEHATATWAYLLEHCPDVTLCALGEGEQTAVEIAEWLDGHRAIQDVAGIAYRVDGKPHQNPPRPRLTGLEQIPRPAWHLFPLEEYLSRGLGHGVNRGRSIPMLATRGCPFQCTFCSSPAMWTTRYMTRSPADVVDEIEAHIAAYAISNVDFEDLTLVIKRSWILEFCRELERRNVRITYQLPSGTRSEALDREVLQALSRTGCRNITYAPESGSLRTLEHTKKKVHLDRMLDSMRVAAELGMIVKVNMIIGFPFEERRDIWDTLRFCMELAKVGVDDIPLYMFVPYPGSELYDELRSKGAIGEMNNDYFAALGFMDVSRTPSFCAISSTELKLYRTLGMIAAMALAYLAHPSRLSRTLRNLLRGTSESSLELQLSGLLKRSQFFGRVIGRAERGAVAPRVPAEPRSLYRPTN